MLNESSNYQGVSSWRWWGVQHVGSFMFFQFPRCKCIDIGGDEILLPRVRSYQDVGSRDWGFKKHPFILQLCHPETPLLVAKFAFFKPECWI